jgi:hypothetical protein
MPLASTILTAASLRFVRRSILPAARRSSRIGDHNRLISSDDREVCNHRDRQHLPSLTNTRSSMTLEFDINDLPDAADQDVRSLFPAQRERQSIHLHAWHRQGPSPATPFTSNMTRPSWALALAPSCTVLVRKISDALVVARGISGEAPIGLVLQR